MTHPSSSIGHRGEDLHKLLSLTDEFSGVRPRKLFHDLKVYAAIESGVLIIRVLGSDWVSIGLEELGKHASTIRGRCARYEASFRTCLHVTRHLPHHTPLARQLLLVIC